MKNRLIFLAITSVFFVGGSGCSQPADDVKETKPSEVKTNLSDAQIAAVKEKFNKPGWNKK